MVQTQHSLKINRGHCVIITNGKKYLQPQNSPSTWFDPGWCTHTDTHTVKHRCKEAPARNERVGWVCVSGVWCALNIVCASTLIFRTWMRLAATDKHQSWMHKQTNVQTNTQTVSHTESRLNGTDRVLQQRDGWPLGNTGCCWHGIILFLWIQLNWSASQDGWYYMDYNVLSNLYLISLTLRSLCNAS